ncbi:hypothetical protein EG856_00140 [Mycoplasmopsis phocirhinis]|uniref:Lipoprotein-associated type-17 domain-containing protein n=1 Tax=Mycoplasmopsis phocirhinis TaxID=142650 RepID=A0A4P6MN95_9BACT|nr:lipoprotein 17-related variable surface protein [Mycoplasmopsis phocirhinis]QBF34350.1 hypothetical protein EG856_00140 [Mycoplasmopsis phocirhinis]
MNKKKLSFITLATTSLAAFPAIAASCAKQTDYSDKITVGVKSGLMSKPASSINISDINALVTTEDKITVTVKEVKVSSESDTTLLVTLDVRDDKTGKIQKVIKTITGFSQPNQATANVNTDAPSVNYSELLVLSVNDEAKKHYAKNMTVHDVSVKLTNSDANVVVSNVATNQNNKTILDVTITITEKNGKTLSIVKQIEGFKPEYPQQIQDAYENLPKNINIVKNIASSNFFATAQDGTKIYWDFRQNAFYDKPYNKNSDNNSRIKLFEINPDFRLGFGVNTASPKQEGMQDSELNNSAILVKTNNGYALKFRLSQYKNKKTPSEFYEDVVISQNQEFNFLTQEQLNEKTANVTLIYPDAGRRKEIDANQEVLTHNLDDQELMILVKSFTPKPGEGKVVVTYTIGSSVGEEILETEVKTQELTGFKVDSFDAQFANLTVEYPSMTQTLPSAAQTESFVFKNGDQTYTFANDVTKTLTIKQDSVNDYKGNLTLVLNVTKDNNSFNKEYSLSGFKQKEFNFEQYINNEMYKPSLNSNIDKTQTNAATLLASNFTLPQYDTQAVYAEISGVSVDQDNNTVAKVSVNWTNLLVENSQPVLKTYDFSGFKAVENKTYRVAELYPLASNGTLFTYVANQDNNEKIKTAYNQSKTKDANDRKVAFIRLDNKGTTITSKKINFSSALSTPDNVKVLTHGNNHNVSWPAKKGSNKGIAIVKDGTKYYLEYVLVLENGEDDTEVFKLELFNESTSNTQN